ncbi:hypothetical protein SOVF_149570 [Spinacia oleracea]|nr:hypothetical protein SOVF_149570 [Spinacia oleracea]
MTHAPTILIRETWSENLPIVRRLCYHDVYKNLLHPPQIQKKSHTDEEREFEDILPFL